MTSYIMYNILKPSAMIWKIWQGGLTLFLWGEGLEWSWSGSASMLYS